MKVHKDLPSLTTSQLELIEGSLIGDGSIGSERNNPQRNWWFTKTQSKFSHSGFDKLEYINWHVEIMKEHARPILNSKIKGNFPDVGGAGKVYAQYQFATYKHPLWKEVGKRWYLHDNGNVVYGANNRKIKIVPRDLKLTPLMLCIWFMDDGSNNSKDGNATISTHGFDIREVDFLVDLLWKDLGIKAKRRLESRKNHPLIYVGSKGYDNLVKTITPLMIWDCFHYKVDRSKYNKIDHRGENHKGSKLTNHQVSLIFELRAQGKSQREICDEMGLGKTSVSLILAGRRWSHLGHKECAPIKPRVSREDYPKIMQLLDSGITQKEVAERYKVNQATISRIAKRQRQ